MLAGLCHFLFSVLYFSFTYPDIKRERKRKKKSDKMARAI
jgi:hypothetical protein